MGGLLKIVEETLKRNNGIFYYREPSFFYRFECVGSDCSYIDEHHFFIAPKSGLYEPSHLNDFADKLIMKKKPTGGSLFRVGYHPYSDVMGLWFGSLYFSEDLGSIQERVLGEVKFERVLTALKRSSYGEVENLLLRKKIKPSGVFDKPLSRIIKTDTTISIEILIRLYLFPDAGILNSVREKRFEGFNNQFIPLDILKKYSSKSA